MTSNIGCSFGVMRAKHSKRPIAGHALRRIKSAKRAPSRLGVAEVPLVAYVFEVAWRSTL
jgi:hypothetical protein